MNESNWASSISVLQGAGVELAPGLSGDELRAAEEHCGCTFPPDLGDFLGSCLPVGDRFPEWRNLGSSRLAAQLSGPFEGIKFDIEHNGFWWPGWGPRPVELDKAFEIAGKNVDAAPRLIPVYGHRYLPSAPPRAGNPVFSVYQTDVIPYGSHLRAYFETEFGGKEYIEAVQGPLRHVSFWTDIVAWNSENSG